MCDACPAPASMMHIYTMSIFTGEWLNLCGECIDQRAEPINSIVYGIQRGALDTLTQDLKDQVRIWTPQGYTSLYHTDRHLKLYLPLAPPRKERDDDERILEIMRQVKHITPDTVTFPTERTFDWSSPLRMLAAIGRRVLFPRRTTFEHDARALPNPVSSLTLY